MCLHILLSFDKIRVNIVGWTNMKFTLLLALMALLPSGGYASSRAGTDARVSAIRMPTMGAARLPNATIKTTTQSSGNTNTDSGNGSGTDNSGGNTDTGTNDDNTTSSGDTGGTVVDAATCREKYRQCMDELCLLDESEGYRCACSDNINRSKSLILEIQNIQEEADKLYTEGVEREQLGAKASYVFGESEKAKSSSLASGFSFSQWLNGDVSGDEDDDGESLGSDADIGDGLFEMAAGLCESELKACGGRAEMEQTLYSRMIVQDCKSFETYLKEQKRNAEANKRTAEKAVRTARVEMMGETQKYNRGTCLLAYKSCIADKGGCGTNFENCLDKKLLNRRAHACDNILDQCTAVKDVVLSDWEEEAKYTLEQAAIYSEKNSRLTCLARIQDCLEEGCSTTTNSQCLVDVNVAAGVCPVIDECEEMIPGIKTVVNDKLGYLRAKFCQNDVDKCLRDKCGDDFTSPVCLGKNPQEIVALCPQDMFPSCKGETQFNIIVQADLLQMDYQLLQGCLNYFGEQLGKVCGTDMTCLPEDPRINSLVEIPETEQELIALRQDIINNSKVAVEEFFKQFEQDKTVAACKSSEGSNLGDTVFTSARMIAEMGASKHAETQLERKIAELSRKQDLQKAEENCRNTYKVEDPNKIEEDESRKEKKNYTYIRSVSFEPSLRNCHVCRMQRVCETGGESKGAAGLKGLAGGLSAGASAGTMVSPGWGTAIGGVIGGVGGLLAGRSAGGLQDFCQEVESCEDINM